MTLGVRFLWTGDPAEGARLLDEIRAAAPVILDDAAVKPYTAVDSVHADPVDPMPVIDAAMLLTDFPARPPDRLLAVAGPGSGSPQVMVEVRQLGGAYAREAGAPERLLPPRAGFSLLVIGMAADPPCGRTSSGCSTALADWDTGGIWPNFGPRTTADRPPGLRPGDPARLAAVARTYDPDGVLQAGRYKRTDLP